MIIENVADNSIENSIQTIASTPYGSAPFARTIGIRNYPPDSYSEMDMNRYATELITQCGIWEDRVSIKEVICDKNEVRVVLDGSD